MRGKKKQKINVKLISYYSSVQDCECLFYHPTDLCKLCKKKKKNRECFEFFDISEFGQKGLIMSIVKEGI